MINLEGRSSMWIGQEVRGSLFQVMMTSLPTLWWSNTTRIISRWSLLTPRTHQSCSCRLLFYFSSYDIDLVRDQIFLLNFWVCFFFFSKKKKSGVTDCSYENKHCDRSCLQRWTNDYGLGAYEWAKMLCRSIGKNHSGQTQSRATSPSLLIW